MAEKSALVRGGQTPLRKYRKSMGQKIIRWWLETKPTHHLSRLSPIVLRNQTSKQILCTRERCGKTEPKVFADVCLLLPYNHQVLNERNAKEPGSGIFPATLQPRWRQGRLSDSSCRQLHALITPIDSSKFVLARSPRPVVCPLQK